MQERLYEITPLVLGDGFDAVEVHLLRYALECRLAARSLDALSASERERAHAFRQHADRVRFVAARQALRGILASRLALAPENVPIEIGKHGKPFVPGAPALCFTLAHSAGIGLIGVSSRYRIGVDVERIDPSFSWSEIAASVFSPAELEALACETEERAVERFYWFWVQKEALLKALGTGLNRDLRQVSIPPDGTNEPVSGGPLLTRLEVGPEYRAALAVLEPPS